MPSSHHDGLRRSHLGMEGRRQLSRASGRGAVRSVGGGKSQRRRIGLVAADPITAARRCVLRRTCCTNSRPATCFVSFPLNLLSSSSLSSSSPQRTRHPIDPGTAPSVVRSFPADVTPWMGVPGGRARTNSRWTSWTSRPVSADKKAMRGTSRGGRRLLLLPAAADSDDEKRRWRQTVDESDETDERREPRMDDVDMTLELLLLLRSSPTSSSSSSSS